MTDKQRKKGNFAQKWVLPFYNRDKDAREQTGNVSLIKHKRVLDHLQQEPESALYLLKSPEVGRITQSPFNNLEIQMKAFERQKRPKAAMLYKI